jgi:DNA polymerase III sliding clamp (beta) subunit (PCNA family)
MTIDTTERVSITLTTNEIGAIASLANCTSSADVTPVLTGIQVIITGGQLRAYSTDRYQAARLTIPVDAPDVSALLPAKWLSGFYATVKKERFATENVLTVEGNVLTISNERSGHSMGTTVIAGQFPPMDRLYPELSDEPVTHVPQSFRAELLATLTKLMLPVDAGLTPAKRFGVWRMQNTIGLSDKPGPMICSQQSKDGLSTIELLIQPNLLAR